MEKFSFTWSWPITSANFLGRIVQVHPVIRPGFRVNHAGMSVTHGIYYTSTVSNVQFILKVLLKSVSKMRFEAHNILKSLHIAL